SSIDSIPPRLVAWTQSRTFSQTCCAASAPAATSTASIAPYPFIWRLASSYPASVIRPGYRTREMRGSAASRSARIAAFCCGRAAEPERERPYAARGEPGLHRARDRAHVASACREVVVPVVPADRHTEQQIGVPGQELGRRVHHDVRAEVERALQQRSGERVV